MIGHNEIGQDTHARQGYGFSHDPFEGHKVIVFVKDCSPGIRPVEDVENDTSWGDPRSTRHGQSLIKPPDHLKRRIIGLIPFSFPLIVFRSLFVLPICRCRRKEKCRGGVRAIRRPAAARGRSGFDGQNRCAGLINERLPLSRCKRGCIHERIDLVDEGHRRHRRTQKPSPTTPSKPIVVGSGTTMLASTLTPNGVNAGKPPPYSSVC